jgi:hypothetical protein
MLRHDTGDWIGTFLGHKVRRWRLARSGSESFEI